LEAVAVRHGHYVPITASIRLHLRQEIEQLFGRDVLDARSTAGYEEARHILEALPLSTEEFGVSVNRLANARPYAETGERGAADYELRLLWQNLER
jgi:hypothetical protein